MSPARAEECCVAADGVYRTEARPDGRTALVFSTGDRSWDVAVSEGATLRFDVVDLDKDGRSDVILREGWEDGWGIFVELQEANSHRNVLAFPGSVPEIEKESAEGQVEIIDAAADEPMQLLLFRDSDLGGRSFPYSTFPYLFTLVDGAYRVTPLSCRPVLARAAKFRLASEIQWLEQSAEKWDRAGRAVIAKSLRRTSSLLNADLARVGEPCD